MYKKKPSNIEEFENMIDYCAKKTMEVSKKVKGNSSAKSEQPWMNDEIRRNIKLRKTLNRSARKSKNTLEQEIAREKYTQQKIKTKCLIMEAIEIHEK